eukprot:1175904-Rhodomonas_salina.1
MNFRRFLYVLNLFYPARRRGRVVQRSSTRVPATRVPEYLGRYQLPGIVTYMNRLLTQSVPPSYFYWYPRVPGYPQHVPGHFTLPG